jgi:hypothetical protein
MSVSSCVTNNTPEPTVKGVIKEFEVEGQRSVAIDAYSRTIVVDLTETADPRSVRVTKIVLGESGTCNVEEGQRIDLSSPITVTIKTLAEYPWTISATQTIERRFAIEGQVGEAYIEVQSRKAFAYVPRGTDLTKVRVTDLKLGPGETSDGITTIAPNLVGEYFRVSDTAEKHRTVDVTYRGTTEQWSLFVTEADTQLSIVSPFAHMVYLVGYGQAGLVNGFQYKKAEDTTPQTRGEDEEGEADNEPTPDPEGWITVPEEDITHDKGVFKTWIKGLEAGAEYVVRAFSGDSRSGEERFTTETPELLPGGGFEGWQSSGKLWLVYAAGDEQYWDTGNHGSITIGESITTPNDDVRPGSSGTKSANLQSAFVGVAGIGKFAAGNLFYGVYAGTQGTNGKVDFGQPFTSRPTALHGWYKVRPGTVTHASSDAPVSAGDPDQSQIVVALTDWSGRHQVNTGDRSTFLNYDTDPGIIAYGDLVRTAGDGGATEEWVEFTIPLTYRDPTRIPTYLVVSISASRYGDYFTGSTDSWIRVDDFELIYDDNIVIE